MANITNLFPVASGTYTEATLGAGADQVAAVQTMDTGTTFVYAPAGTGKRNSYTVDGNMISFDSVIDSIDVHVWVGAGTGTINTMSIQAGVVIGGTMYLNSAQTVSSQTYTLFTFTITNNPATASPWTKYDLDALEIVFRANAGIGTAPLNITQVYTDITFQPNSDALSFG